MFELTVFYDGFCPLCVREVKKLSKLDKRKRMQFVDIQAEGFENQYPLINKQEANRILIGQKADGSITKGLDTTHAAWTLAGKSYVTAWLRWPIISFFTDKAYLIFAKHRYTLSAIFTGQKRCEACQIDSDACNLSDNSNSKR